MAKVLGDVGESLANFTSSVAQIADTAVKTYDGLARRKLRQALTGASVTLSSVLADQRRVKPTLDRYGDLWRRYNTSSHRITKQEREQLDDQWKRAVEVMTSVAQGTVSALATLQTFDGDVVLDEAYIELKAALTGNQSILDEMSRMPAPRSPTELQDLVHAEETFLRLDVEARRAVEGVNTAIRGI